MAKLADAIAAETRSKGPACNVAIAEAKLDKASKADLAEALADESIPASALARGLAAVAKHNVRAEAMLKHRKGECGCAS